MDRVSADSMGMLSTVINAIALQDSIEKRGVQCRVMSAVFMNQLASLIFVAGPCGTWKRAGW